MSDRGWWFTADLAYEDGWLTFFASNGIPSFDNDPDAIDLVISDFSMPRMSGLALARELLRRRPDLPIILCTGFSSDLTEDELKNAGIRKLLFKPLIVATLAETIREVLDGSASGSIM